MKIKAITLWQPWATLIAIGAKKIETRSWSTNYRGPLAIHAAKYMPEDAWDLCHQEPIFGTLIGAGFTHNRRSGNGQTYAALDPKRFSFGAIIATCNLVECLLIPSRQTKFTTFHKRHVQVYLPPEAPESSFGDYTPGRYAWILDDIRALPEPIPARGRQGLWDIELPEEVIRGTR